MPAEVRTTTVHTSFIDDEGVLLLLLYAVLLYCSAR